MTERTIDPTRQGGSDTGPKRGIPTTVPLTIEEAFAYRDHIAWRTFKPRGDRAVVALAGEVEQLRLQQAELQKICRIENAEVRRLIGEVERLEKALEASESACGGHADDLMDTASELARFRAALPGIIGCALGQGVICGLAKAGNNSDPCCVTHRHCVMAGLLPAREPGAETEDGA